jgi:hypothetical protein
MKRVLRFSLAGFCLLALGSVNALVIDAFNNTGMALIATNSTAMGISGAVTTAIGHARKLTISQVTNANPAITAAAVLNLYNRPDVLSVSNGDKVNSVVTVIWDGQVCEGSPPPCDVFAVKTNGLNHANLMGQNDSGFLLRIPSIDLSVKLDLTVWDSDSNATYSYTSPQPGTQFIPYSGFVGIEFSDVGAIRLVLSSQKDSWDGSIEILETRPNPAPIPGTAVLLGVGLLGLARRARRVKSPG